MRITIGLLAVTGNFEPGEDDDVILNAASRALDHAGYQSIVTRSSSPDAEALQAAMLELCSQCDVLFTVGGSGFGKDELAPEITQSITERSAPGLEELIRANLHKRAESSHLHRGIAGIRGDTVVINLPGSAELVKESIETVALLLRPMMSSLKGMHVVQDVH